MKWSLSSHSPYTLQSAQERSQLIRSTASHSQEGLRLINNLLSLNTRERNFHPDRVPKKTKMFNLLRGNHATFRVVYFKSQALKNQDCKLRVQPTLLISWSLNEKIIQISQNEDVECNPEVFHDNLKCFSENTRTSSQTKHYDRKFVANTTPHKSDKTSS